MKEVPATLEKEQKKVAYVNNTPVLFLDIPDLDFSVNVNTYLYLSTPFPYIRTCFAWKIGLDTVTVFPSQAYWFRIF